MTQVPLSIAGANTLLGQHLLARLAGSKVFRVTSLHDKLALQGVDSIADSQDWSVNPEVAEIFRQVPLLAPDAAAQAPLLASFLPDDDAQRIETLHLDRGTRVLTHGEYARLSKPLAIPGRLHELDRAAQHCATPNCTTAMCTLPLQALQSDYGIATATITALQAISGTDIPGMQAHAIHDQVVGHLPGEADALSNELGLIFSQAFPVHTFATRVPVWRGHTLTLAIELKKKTDLAQVEQTLRAMPGIQLLTPSSGLSKGRPLFHPDKPMATVGALRIAADHELGLSTACATESGTHSKGPTIMMTLTGDNLEAATSGLMLAALKRLAQADESLSA